MENSAVSVDKWHYLTDKLPLDKEIDKLIDFLTEHFAFLTKAISKYLATIIEASTDGLMALPPWLVITIFAALAWRLAGRNVGIFTLLGLGLLWNLRLWEPTMETLILVLVATVIAIIVGIPLGVWSALSPMAYRIIMPILDFMQTMPAFVYLIPAIPFFGLGAVSAIFATVIFAVPPAIRLTCLGIKQVPRELIEAADAFGSTRGQKLFKLQLPLAIPTIMAGINQTIMLALSMVVIAAMIGAGGLGSEVWKAIQRLEPGKGFEAGIAIVILAMILDRITQKIGKQNSPERQ
ncbi:glycine betaine/proline transport system permease protein [Thioploca ingrica]|uniref:Glycine betaine/proline transport system permease protein n=1 Tax=Thioploca ingrica TaxID=40754 RepID=A0A090AGB2_9GAMM|nr:glycine betaine/proline transport system permease protein [Thioploca ingrica]